MAYKVVVWGTGFVGKMVIREIADHPEFDLVGVIVHDPEKAGRDAGELSGIAPIGVTCETDAEAVLDRGADALAYYGPTAQFARENIENMSMALRRGIDVVSTSMTPFVYPPACSDKELGPLVAACEEGGASCFTTGIDPGFANDLFPMTLMGLCGRVDSIRIQEILDYSTYTGDYAVMGFGLPVAQPCLLEDTGILTYAWGHTIYMMADALGIELDRVDSVYEKWPTPEPIDYPGGRIEADTCAAVRFEIQGIVAGEPRIVIEHCNRITGAAAPHWPRPKMSDNDAYRVIVKGSPDIEQETAFRGAGGDPNAGGCLATGMRALSAIPAVIAAEPGVVSALDLPLIAGRGVMRAG